jgi:DNA replication protein DnaC
VCPLCHGNGWFRPPEPRHDSDRGDLYELVPCECRKEAARRRAAERLSTSLGRLSGARWTDLVTRDGWTPEERESFEACRRSGQRFGLAPHYALVLAGPTGNGKTTILACVANDLLTAGRVPLFAKVPDLLDRLRESFRPRQDKGEAQFDALYDDLKNADVLLLDDLGTENPTPWAVEKLYQLVDYRYANGLPMAVTTNLRPAQLAALSDRIYSRLASHMVVNRTPDHRVTEGW